MKLVNRKKAMFVCLIVMTFFMIESITGNLILYFEARSLVFGFIVGWALRETLEPKKEREE